MALRLLLFPCRFKAIKHLCFNWQPSYTLAASQISIIHTLYNAPSPAAYTKFTFHSVPDSLLDSEVAATQDVISLLNTLNDCFVAPFSDHLAHILSEYAAAKEPVACLITDAIWYWTPVVADSFKLPRIVLRTSSASCFQTFMKLPLFREKGLPFCSRELEEYVPELEPLRMKDILLLGTKDPSATYELVLKMLESTKASKGLILNTSEELEGLSLDSIHQEMSIPVFALGPFYIQLSASSHSLFVQDRSCLSWLNSQQTDSVLYVSFGSLAEIDEKEFIEIAWGLANSKQPFLWVIRPGLVRSSSDQPDPLPDGFMEIVAERGRIVKWAPQEEVLAHPAVGAFWTHCGWNSTLESICEGVPMLCHLAW